MMKFYLFLAFFSLFLPFSELHAEEKIDNASQARLEARLAEWEDLTAPAGAHYPASSYVNFLKNPEIWPLEARIESRYEANLARETDPQTLKSLCPLFPLKQFKTVLICETYLHNLPQNTVKIWENTALTKEDEAVFLSHYQAFLTKDANWQRFTFLLRIRNKEAAKRQLTRLTSEQQILATAIFNLKFSPETSLTLYQDLPAEIRHTPSLLIAQLHALRLRKDFAASYQFWSENNGYFTQQTPKNEISLWQTEQLALARTRLSQREIPLTSQETDALLKLTDSPSQNPAHIFTLQEQDTLLLHSYLRILAQDHLENMLVNLKPLLSSPILSRRAEAFFLSAEAEKSLHHEKNYQDFLLQAAQLPTSFYGQFSLALLTHAPFLTSSERNPLFWQKLKEELALIPKLPQGTPPTNNLIKAAQLLADKGDMKNTTLFLSFLLGRTSQENALLGINQRALQLQLPKISILIGRRLAIRGKILYPDAYPPPYDRRLFPQKSSLLPKGLFNALIRQESSADPDAISAAHAVGLTQILLGTAQQTARKNHLSFPFPLTFSTLTNPATNLLLGQTYLESLYQEFNGNIPLTLAAYNAGPHRAASWNFPAQANAPISAEKLRIQEMEALHWLITLPYAETRIYITHIMADMTIYALNP